MGGSKAAPMPISPLWPMQIVDDDWPQRVVAAYDPFDEFMAHLDGVDYLRRLKRLTCPGLLHDAKMDRWKEENDIRKERRAKEMRDKHGLVWDDERLTYLPIKNWA